MQNTNNKVHKIGSINKNKITKQKTVPGTSVTRVNVKANKNQDYSNFILYNKFNFIKRLYL